MASYQTRAKRIEPGRYQLTYGKGNQKLSCTIWKNDLAGTWQISEGDGQDQGFEAQTRKKDLVAAWGQWAEQNYGAGAAESPGHEKSEGQPPASNPTGPARKGPPKHKPSLKEKGPPKRRRSEAAGKGPPKRDKPPDTQAVAQEVVNIAPGDLDPDKVERLYGAALCMLNWAWRNRRDLNQKPWDDAMRVLHDIDPDTYAKYKLENSK